MNGGQNPSFYFDLLSPWVNRGFEKKAACFF